MKKINLQLFDESRAALLRNAIADYAGHPRQVLL